MNSVKKITQQNSLKSVAAEHISVLCSSTSSLYLFLKQNRKAAFSPKEKIFIVAPNTVSDRFLNHLQSAATFLDIENFYISFVTKGFQAAIDQAGFPQYATEEIELPHEYTENLIDTTNLCPMPWMHTMVDILGNYRPCCVYRKGLFSTKTHTIEDFFNSDYMQDLRSQFINNQQPDGCSHCWDLENKNVESHRQRNFRFYQEDFLSNYIDNPTIKSMDLRLGNTCNFRCRICSPRESSKIAGELIKTDKSGEIRDLIKKGQWFDNDPDFVDQFINLLSNIDNLDFYGGEPWLLKTLPKLLNSAIESGDSKHIRLHFNTNGSVYNTQLFEYFEQFQFVDIAISIDDIGERFEIQRGGEWDTVESNLQNIFSHKQNNISCYIMPTVNIQNVLYLDQLYQWAQKNQYPVVLNFLENPQALNIDYLTDAAKRAVVSRYQKHSVDDLKKIADRVSNNRNVSDGTAFQHHHEKLDSLRKQSFKKTHKEIANLMGIV